MKILTVLILVLFLSGAGFAGYLYFEASARNKELSLLLDEARNIKVKLQDEVAQLGAKQQTLQNENIQLKKESLNFLKQQQGINQKRKQLEEIIKQQIYESRELRAQIQEEGKKLKQLEEQNKKLGDISDLAGNIQLVKQKSKISELEEQLVSLKKQYNKQEALLHYNLGVSYTKERNYEMAIDEYEKAMALSPEDADAHYNLAVIYGDWRKNPRRAIGHYKKYLELKPDAPDIDEVKNWIARLEREL